MMDYKISERNWQLLVSAIEEGRVVPIIGNDMIYVVDGGKQEKVIDYILEALKAKFEIEDELCNNLTALETAIADYCKETGDDTDIYFEINHILKGKEITVPENLKALFSLARFPLTLTTSFVHGLDEALGTDNDKTVVYKHESANDVTPVAGSMALVHMFGISGVRKRSFMAVEDDLLDYMHSWQNPDTRPVGICSTLANRVLLILGCDYPDWLFRFFWHTIRNFTVRPRTEGMQGVFSANDETENRNDNLRKFLFRIKTSFQKDTDGFLQELNKRIGESGGIKIDNRLEQTDIHQNPDIFISYAKPENREQAMAIADIFRRYGAKVWVDTKLEPGDDQNSMFDNMIRKCKRFVPIISEANFKEGRRTFKHEWSIAKDAQSHLLEYEKYIVPIVVDETSRDDSRIPREFSMKNSLRFPNPDFDDQVKSIIRSFR